MNRLEQQQSSKVVRLEMATDFIAQQEITVYVFLERNNCLRSFE
jgi:hypothetical protein